MKKLLALLLSLVMIFTFAACSSSESAGSVTETTTDDTESLKIATDTIDKKFNEIKKMDATDYFDALMGEETDDLSEAEKEVVVQIFDAVKKPFKYKLISTEKVDDKTIKATLEITSVDGNAAAKKFYEDFIDYFVNENTADTQPSDEEIDLQFMKCLATAFASSGTTTNKIIIEVSLVDGKWTVKESDADLFGLFCNNFSNRFKELGDELINSVV